MPCCGHRQAAAHRQLAQADVVRRRAGGVLQEVAERPERPHGSSSPHPGVGGAPSRAHLAAREHRAPPPGAAPGRPEGRRCGPRRRPGRCRGPTRVPRRRLPAISTRDARHRGAQARAATSSASGQGLAPAARAPRPSPPLGAARRAARRSGRRWPVRTRDAGQPAVGGGRDQLVEVAHPETSPRAPRRALGRCPRGARSPRGPRGRARAARRGPRSRRSRPARRSSTGACRRCPGGRWPGPQRHPRDRLRGGPHPRGAAAVGQHAVAHRALHLEQVAEQLQPSAISALVGSSPATAESKEVSPRGRPETRLDLRGLVRGGATGDATIWRAPSGPSAPAAGGR